MFVPRVRLHYSSNEYPAFSSRRRRPRQKERRPFKLADFIHIPCLLPTLVGTLIGSLISVGGITMSILGYYPETSILSQGLRLPPKPPDPPKNPHLKVLAYIGPPVMAMGAFTVIVSCVMYCEFRDKYLRVEDDIKIRGLKKDAVYELVVESFRRNYFRGIALPFEDSKLKSLEPNDGITNSSDSNVSSIGGNETNEARNPSYKVTFPASSRRSSVVTHPIKRSDFGHKANSMPNIKPFHASVASALMAHVSYARRKSNNVAFDDFRLSRNYDAVRRSSMASSSLGSTSTGIINPAYEQDDEPRRQRRRCETRRSPRYLCVHHNRPVSEGDSNDCLPVVIVHRASVHQVDIPDHRRNSVNTLNSGGSYSPLPCSATSSAGDGSLSNNEIASGNNAHNSNSNLSDRPCCVSRTSIDSNCIRSMLTSFQHETNFDVTTEGTDLQNIEMKEVTHT
ncbi:unnamed protein product [Acanthosepion pharaonis]|uniref:Uncharacterized protein n=1 Tax=Acanthosepion pharaonis TaxID=158019 RepID=A0A812DMH6_ACAPH|nr:unnamed protein product [Sepia pharaonis]